MATDADPVLAAARAFLAEKYPLVEAAYRESVAHDLAAFARSMAPLFRAAALEEAAQRLDEAAIHAVVAYGAQKFDVADWLRRRRGGTETWLTPSHRRTFG